MAALSKEEAAERVRQLRVLLARPAEDIRAVAIAQRDRLAAKLDRWFVLGPGAASYKEKLAQITAQIAEGDALKDRQDEDSRTKRRRLYAYAYDNARQTALLLDQDFAADTPSILTPGTVFPWLWTAGGEVVDKVADVAGDVAEGAGKAVKAVAETGQTTLYILAGGLALAAVAFAYSRGASRRSY